MASLLEMTVDIVKSHAQTAPLTTEELVQELAKVYSALQALESGVAAPQLEAEIQNTAPETPALTLKQAFKTNEVVCMICGKTGMKTITRHLNQAHQMKPAQYRKQFNIPKTTPLMSKAYAAKRKEIAAGMDLGANLEKARAARQTTPQKSKGKKK